MFKRLLSIFDRVQLSNDDLQEAHILGKFVSDSIGAVFDLAGCTAGTFPLERGQGIGSYVIGYCDVMSQCIGNDSKSDISVEACREAYKQLFGVDRGRGLMRMMELGTPEGANTCGVDAGRVDALDNFTRKAPPFGLMNLLMGEYQSSCSTLENLRGFEQKWAASQGTRT